MKPDRTFPLIRPSLVFAKYSLVAFNNLNTFFTAKEELVGSSLLLPELGKIICRYNLQEQVGVSLLHKHFDLDEDELLVETISNNTVRISPAKVQDTDGLVPYIWKLESNSDTRARWIPLEFAHDTSGTSIAAELADKVSQNSLFLNDMATKLGELGLATIFGLTTLHRQLTKQHNEITVERTNDALRVLNIEVRSRSEVDFSKLTQTLWKFTPNEEVETACYCHHCGHCDHW